MNNQSKSNWILCAAGLLGASAVALGAYAAHGLEGQLESLSYSGGDLVHRIENFQTGARYQLHAAAALLAIGLFRNGSGLRLAAWTLAGGSLVFCGLLYVLAFSGEETRWLGAIVPLGGLAMIVAWGAIAVLGWLGTRPEEETVERTLNADQVRLEELLTHQQHLLQDLDTVVTELRGEADALSPKIASLEQTVRRLVELQEGAEDVPDERPPHY